VAGRFSRRHLLSVIDDIYRASLNPEDWEHVVAGVQAIFPETGVSIQAHHHGDAPQFLVLEAGHDPNFVRDYQRDYAPINPWAARIPRMPLGVPVVIDDSPFLPEISKTGFHDFLTRNGYESGVGLPIWSAPQRAFFMACHYPRPAAPGLNEPVRQLASELSPHLARSFAISHRLSAAPGEPSGLASLLQQVAAPVLVLDEARRVTFTNPAGEDFLASRPQFNRRPCGFTLSDPSADAALGEAVRACIRHQFHGRPPPMISMAGPGDPLRVIVMPLIADATLSKGPVGGAAATRRLALLLFFGARPPCDTLALLRTKFGLTTAEAEIAAALSNGSSLNECASRRGVAIPTVRNQLQSIFAKTSTSRQAELVALLSRLGQG
jgi:DNA-binding CsgD family transcriptional regulator